MLTADGLARHLVRGVLQAGAMLLVSGCVAPLPPPKTSPIHGAAKAERPVWHVGDRWEYRSLHPAQPAMRTDQVVRKAGDDYVIRYALAGYARPQKIVLAIEPDDRAEDHVTPTLALDKGSRAHGVVQYTPPFEWYRWPLEVGQRWTVDGTFRSPSRSALVRTPEVEQYRVTFAVEAHEEITVPAGRFKAFKIRARISGGPPLGRLFHDDFVQWYSPAVKRYVRFEFPVGVDRGFAPPEISIRGWELLEFEPARPR